MKSYKVLLITSLNKILVHTKVKVGTKHQLTIASSHRTCVARLKRDI